MNEPAAMEIHVNGFTQINAAVDLETVGRLSAACEQAFIAESDVQRARSSRGHVYAARNLLDVVPEIQTFWREGKPFEILKCILGDQFGLVRVLFFDKPPDRTWTLPWHKDTAIAVGDNSHRSERFSRPTVKSGVPHVVASDDVLRQMLTLRLHLDDVTDQNGPLRVIPGSHVSSTSGGAGVEAAVTIHAAAGDMLAMRPLITHSSGSSKPGTTRHRRILHLEFAADRHLPDGFQWHDFIAASLTTN
ncbi:phytanoyl-CoA dioxygenase family protein [Novipirellula sp.]|uniref:phytanoyl-CoA dioxygenase family protein n=1 Tax=Novipirellula sp. TaxID=2795430 RepID=UPI003561EDC1